MRIKKLGGGLAVAAFIMLSMQMGKAAQLSDQAMSMQSMRMVNMKVMTMNGQARVTCMARNMQRARVMEMPRG